MRRADEDGPRRARTGEDRRIEGEEGVGGREARAREAMVWGSSRRRDMLGAGRATHEGRDEARRAVPVQLPRDGQPWPGTTAWDLGRLLREGEMGRARVPGSNTQCRMHPLPVVDHVVAAGRHYEEPQKPDDWVTGRRTTDDRRQTMDVKKTGRMMEGT